VTPESAGKAVRSQDLTATPPLRARTAADGAATEAGEAPAASVAPREREAQDSPVDPIHRPQTIAQQEVTTEVAPPTAAPLAQRRAEQLSELPAERPNERLTERPLERLAERPRAARETPSSRASPAAAPQVQITIGRVEIRAAAPQPPQAPRGPTMSLDDYLARRAGG